LGRRSADPDLGLLLGRPGGLTTPSATTVPFLHQTAAVCHRRRWTASQLASDRRRIDPRTRLSVLLRASEIEMVRFNGFGNETPRAGAAAAVAHWQLTLAPSFERDLSPSLRARVGPVLRYGTTDRDGGTLLRRDQPLGRRLRGSGPRAS
jgi:hypothetical protein